MRDEDCYRYFPDAYPPADLDAALRRARAERSAAVAAVLARIGRGLLAALKAFGRGKTVGGPLAPMLREAEREQLFRAKQRRVRGF